jgi:hypothetical protein
MAEQNFDTYRGKTPLFELAAATATLTGDDTGKTFLVVTTADQVITLPAASAALKGTRYKFVVTAGALSGGTGFSLSPAAADAIASAGLTSVDNKDLINSGATDSEGDFVEIVCDGGATGEQGWYVTSMKGTWAKEP